MAVVWDSRCSRSFSAQSAAELYAGTAGLQHGAPCHTPSRALRSHTAGRERWCMRLAELAADRTGQIQPGCRSAAAQPLYGSARAAHQRPVYSGDGGAMATELAPEPLSKVSRRYACLASLCLALLAPLPVALAHQSTPLTPSVTWMTWSRHPWVMGSLMLAAWLYRRGVRTIWRTAARECGVRRSAIVAFWGGWVALGVALFSPLHALGAVCFSAHMLQHEVLMLVAAPLLGLGRPLLVCLWALPLTWRRQLGKWGKGMRGGWHVLSH